MEAKGERKRKMKERELNGKQNWVGASPFIGEAFVIFFFFF